jgi:hypothetical protein
MMFLFEFKAKPEASNPDQKTLAGAFVNCWISRGTKAKAEAVARRMIEKHGWTIVEFVKGRRITRNTQRLSGMKYYKQASIDKEVLVFHVWPIKKTRKRSTEQLHEPDAG